MLELLQTLLLAAGALFCLIGSFALLRFPDVYTRIHALTKVDNLGLGLVVLGLLLTADSLMAAAKLLLIWLLVLFASATTGHLIARNAELRSQTPWRQDAGPQQPQSQSCGSRPVSVSQRASVSQPVMDAPKHLEPTAVKSGNIEQEPR